MNLFCFSLEGSTDSLYEAPQPNPNPTPQWDGLEPCFSQELLRTPTEPTEQHNRDLKKAKRKSRTSERTQTSDTTASSNVYCPCTGKTDDRNHDQAECVRESPYITNPLVQEKRTETVHDVEAGEDNTHGTLKKIHKTAKSSVKENRNNSESSEDATVITCVGLSKKSEKKYGKDSNQQNHPENQKNSTEMESLWSPGHSHHHWGSMDTCSFWESSYHTCHRPTTDPWLYNVNFTLPRGTDRHRYEELIYDLDLLRTEYPPQRVIHSFTNLDLTTNLTNNTSLRAMLQRRASNASEKPRNKPKRSYSFGRFDASKNQSRLEEHEGTLGQGADGESAEGEHLKGGLGKKMKAISLTMRKKIGKKYSKVLSEEMSEDVDADQEVEEGVANASQAPAERCTNSSNSVESLFSLHSGQSSSSAITSGSEGPCNTDSLKLEEEVPDNIQFCGRAKVHTDFLPSPYDTESLKLKVGDMIDIISKPSMGIWTGMLNGKVGSFKFIYVDVLPEEPAPVHRMGNHRRSRRPRPKTLQEFLERLHLEEFMSSLLLNGYQTVDDLKDLKEQHLIELNVTDPEHRHKLLAATECLHDVAPTVHREGEGEDVPKSPSMTVKVEPNDCPRDSGCYVASDCSDNSKEDTESQVPTSLSPSPAEV